MYSESDIESAVAEGILTAEAAAALRDHVARKREMPPADEEHFRLLGGFNDVFVALALILVLAFPIVIGQGFLVAFACWALAEFITRRRRLALPSIVLLLAYSGSIWFEVLDQVGRASSRLEASVGASGTTAASALTFAATFLYWWRFRVPMAQAVMAGVALAGLVLAVADYAPEAELTWPLLGLGGLAIFAYAMHWDLSDRDRRTHRADVAFWLHLLAAPLIAHSAFSQIGLFSSATPEWAPIVLVIYLFFALVALVVDRRAILVSGLGYAVAAVSGLMGDVGAGLIGGTLLLGGTLLTLGLFWPNARAAVVVYVPERLRSRLPPIERRPG
jgi:hypothetical protein